MYKGGRTASYALIHSLRQEIICSLIVHLLEIAGPVSRSIGIILMDLVLRKSFLVLVGIFGRREMSLSSRGLLLLWQGGQFVSKVILRFTNTELKQLLFNPTLIVYLSA
jgi:hypothetical protein